jgi:signal transduction histidine kinase
MGRLSTKIIFSYILVVLMAVTIVGVFALPLLQNSENARTQADLEKQRNDVTNRLNTVNLLIRSSRAVNPFKDYLAPNPVAGSTQARVFPAKPTVEEVQAGFNSIAQSQNLRLLIIGERPNEVWLDTETDQTKKLIGQIVALVRPIQALATSRAGASPNADALVGGNPYFIEEQLLPPDKPDKMRYQVITTRVGGQNAPNLFGLNARNNTPNEYWLVALFPTPTPTDVTGDLLRILLIAGSAALLVSFLVGLFLARSLTRPLVKVTQASQALAKGEYNYRVVPEGSDETLKLAQSFNTMADEIFNSQRLQRELITNVSHELRTPLTAIKGFSQAMVDGVLKKPEDFIYPAELIHTETERMIRLVNSLLDLSKLESGQAIIAKENIELGNLLEKSLRSFQNRAELAEVKLLRDFAYNLYLIGDQDRLRQVFNNLIDNALRYTPTGGSITLSAYRNGQNIIAKVSDSGTGIPVEDLPHVFERFFQADKSRSKTTGGLGLGLAISKEIISAHGGKIEVESELGRGTTFTITLPAQPAKQLTQPSRLLLGVGTNLEPSNTDKHE